MKKINIGFIGAGHIAESMAKTISKIKEVDTDLKNFTALMKKCLKMKRLI